MNRDPFYRDIIKGLNGPLDAELFERCACDLLRAFYPTLVPIRGGSDMGMDGAIADGKESPFPLVCTTAKDVSRNLKQSLGSYLEEGGTRRCVVVATSQELTAKRRKNLEQVAQGLGFTLIQIHTKAAIADLLYRNPQWCKELLNLTGNPPPLSVQPVSNRPSLSQTLVGREDDIAWLRDTAGDLLLIGQPGSGKTSSLQQLAKEGQGLFVISDDLGQIAEGIRKQQPKALMIDDAHLRCNLIRKLCHLRTEVGANFRILTDCWPGQEDEVARSLGLPKVTIRHLDLLTRDQVVKVIKGTGITGPNALIQELVDQADGKPGLAVTLCYLCLQGDVRDVALGDALCRDIQTTFEPLVGREATTILAAFAVGGEYGMPLSVVARHLGLKDLHVRDVVTKLAAGGVLEVNKVTLAVRPAALRHALVRDVFFQGAASLEIQGLIQQAPNLADVTLTLLGARSRGAKVPETLLRDLLENSNSDKAWEWYAALGSEETGWVLEQHPEKLMIIARYALQQAPKKVIPLLLTKAVGDDRQLHSNLDHPLRLIEDWVHEAWPGREKAVGRRTVLLEATLVWLNGGGDISVGLKAFPIVMSPAFADTESDPGSGNTITIRRGYVTSEELAQIQALWSRILDCLRAKGVSSWAPIQEIVQEWAHPHGMGKPLPEEFVAQMEAFAGCMLQDVAEVARDRPGILGWAREMAKSLGVKVEITLDPEFEVLFPAREDDAWEESHKRQADAVKALAKAWATKEPKERVDRLILFEKEARLSGRTWPRWTSFLCQEIASLTDEPIVWSEAFFSAGAPSDFVQPFLERAASLNASGLENLLEKCLGNPGFRSSAVFTVLKMPSPPAQLLQNVLANLEGLGQGIKHLCWNNEIPEDRVTLLLRHQDRAAAAAAAAGEWQAQPEGTVRASLQADWRAAVVRCLDDEYSLGKMFKADPALGFDWLVARIKEKSNVFWRHEGNIVQEAVEVLDGSQRRLLLLQIPKDFWHGELITKKIVGEDLELYRYLLGNNHLKHLHLEPLVGYPEGIWIEKAKVALEAGYSPEDVVAATFGSSWGWSGEESDMWAGWVQRFERLCSHDDPRIKRVGKAGSDRAQADQERALSEERKEAIYGRRSRS